MTDYTTIAELQAAIDALVPLMAEKGVIKPRAEYRIVSQSGGEIWLRCADEGTQVGSFNAHIISAKGGIRKTVDAARAYIAVLPDPETAALHRYMNDLGKVVDQGRKDGIPDEYTQPVSLTIKAMSENLLTHTPTNEGADA